MNVRALLNAGGAGTRMGAPLPKPLLPVRGLPLIERNLLALLGAGLRELHVVVPASAPALQVWSRTRASVLCHAVGGRLTLHVEAEPRGTAACLSAVRASDATVLMLYADNMTGLDLARFVAEHAGSGADVSIATHEETFVVPYGRIRADGQRVIAYDEKPALPVTVASGAYLFSPSALESLPDTGRLDAPELVTRRVNAGRLVRIFSHNAPWVDVNDAAALVRAGRLLDAHPALERFAPADGPVLEVCGAVLTDTRGVLLEWRPRSAALSPGVWDTPGGKLEPGETAIDAMARELEEELGLRRPALRPLAVLDELAPGHGWMRHHVFAASLDDGPAPTPREGQRLEVRPLDAVDDTCAQIVRRSLSYWGANP